MTSELRMVRVAAPRRRVTLPVLTVWLSSRRYAGTLALLCRSWAKLATIDNHWHLDNEERGRIIAGCHLRRPLGTIWHRDIGRNDL